MWTSQLPNVIATYTKPDGSVISGDDFVPKDSYIEIVARPEGRICRISGSSTEWCFRSTMADRLRTMKMSQRVCPFVSLAKGSVPLTLNQRRGEYA